MQQRVARYRRLYAAGIYPDPETMGLPNERERKLEREAAALAKGEIVVTTSAGEVLRRATMRVRLVGVRKARFRIWLMTTLMRLAVWAGGVGGLEVVETTGDERDEDSLG